MRIVLMGQAPFGAKTLEALLAAGEEVVAVYAPAASPGGKPDPLQEAAQVRGVQHIRPMALRDDREFEAFTRFAPDLVVLAFVTDIVPIRYFAAAREGALCYHPSLLPRHRGASAINWALIMGEETTGLTIFRPDAGIDTGPILLQKSVAIGPRDTAGSLYFERLFPMGVEALVESVKLLGEGKARFITQDDSKATYEPRCDDRVAGIDWSAGGREIFNLVRGCDPQPGAYARFRGETVRFYGAEFLPGNSDAPPGSIAGVDERGLRIAVAGGELLVAKVRTPSAAKMDGAAFAAAHDIHPGDRFEVKSNR